MKRAIGTLAALSLLLICSLVGAAAVGTVAAQSSGDLANETVTVDNDTRAVYAQATNITNDTADVTVYGIDANGNETQEATGTLDTSTTETDLYEFTSVDAANYSEYRVVITGDGADSTEIGTVQEVSGGGGGFIGGSGGVGLGVLVVAAFVGLAFIMRD